MSSLIPGSPAYVVLESLYADAARAEAQPRPGGAGPREGPRDEMEFFHTMRHAYMAIGRQFGRLLYGLVRGTGARNVVEFGMSFGISTIYLAAGLRDNGAGKVITTEFEPEKAAKARQNIADAGLADFVEVRLGDALQTLKADLPATIDLVLLDGAKSMYFDVLKLIEPRLRKGALVASDNTDHEGMENFLRYIREPANGYLTSAIQTNDRTRPSGHEISVRL